VLRNLPIVVDDPLDQNFVGKIGSAPEQSHVAWPVRHQTPIFPVLQTRSVARPFRQLPDGLGDYSHLARFETEADPFIRARKSVLETVGERATERAGAAIPSPSVAVPASLHASLMARLDRLGPAKEMAQLGAAIGREFSHALLAAVARKREAELGSALDRLVAAGLLFRQGVPPEAYPSVRHT
jgi:hypothetical protein